MPEMIGKVEEVRNKLNALRSNAYLEVDGGISVDTLPLMYKAGANAFVAGNAAFKHPQGVGEGIKALRECVASYPRTRTASQDTERERYLTLQEIAPSVRRTLAMQGLKQKSRPLSGRDL